MDGAAHPDGPAEVLPAGSLLKAVVNVEYLDYALQMIHAAKQSIQVVHFECNQDSTIDAIVNALIEAQARGIKVRVLLEGDVDDNGPRVKEFTEAGVECRLDSDKRYTHVKLFIVDSHRVLLGSTNLSYKSILYNNETNLYLDSPIAAAYLEKYVESLWQTPEATPELAPVGDEAIGLIRVLHDEDYFNVVSPLLQAADKKVYLLVYGFHLNPRYPDSEVHKLAGALVEARQRGLEVKVVLEASDYNETLNDINQGAADYLSNECVPVRFDPLDVISHAKLLIIDDVAVVGSNNWGHGGFHLYHEVGGVTDNAEAVGELTEYFLGIWEESSSAGRRCR